MYLLTAASLVALCKWCTFSAKPWVRSRANAKASTSVQGLMPTFTFSRVKRRFSQYFSMPLFDLRAVRTSVTRRPALDSSNSGATPAPRFPAYLIMSIASSHMESARSSMYFPKPIRFSESVVKWLDMTEYNKLWPMCSFIRPCTWDRCLSKVLKAAVQAVKSLSTVQMSYRH